MNLVLASEWLPVPALIGASLYLRQLHELVKGRTHKYIRRVPYVGADGKRRYRYYYHVRGGKGVGHEDEIKSGAKFRIKHGDHEGHFHVEAVKDGQVQVVHDESGHSVWMSKKSFGEMIREEHADLIQEHHERVRKEHKATTVAGMKKQVEKRALKYGIKLEKPPGEPKKKSPFEAGLDKHLARYPFDDKQKAQVEKTARGMIESGLYLKNPEMAAQRAADGWAKRWGVKELSAAELEQRKKAAEEAARKRRKKPGEPKKPKKEEPISGPHINHIVHEIVQHMLDRADVPDKVQIRYDNAGHIYIDRGISTDTTKKQAIDDILSAKQAAADWWGENKDRFPGRKLTHEKVKGKKVWYTGDDVYNLRTGMKLDRTEDETKAILMGRHNIQRVTKGKDELKPLKGTPEPTPGEISTAPAPPSKKEEPSWTRNSLEWTPGMESRPGTVSIKRGDTVHAWFKKDDYREGKVTGLSAAKGKIKVDGVWHDYRQVYTTEEYEKRTGKKKAPKLVIRPEPKPEVKPAGKPSAFATAEKPSKVWQAHMRSIREGEPLTADQHRANFEDLIANKDTVIAELRKYKKAQLAGFSGLQWHVSAMKKEQLVQASFRHMAEGYLLSSHTDEPFSVTSRWGHVDPIDNVRQKIADITDEDLAEVRTKKEAAAKEREAKAEEQQKRIENPQTQRDWYDRAAHKGGYDKLSDEDKEAYDLAYAKHTRTAREKRKQEAAAKREKERAEYAARYPKREVSETAGTMSIVAGKHTKKGHDIWTVVPQNRVDKEAFKELKALAKQHGGYYSSYRGGGATPGFVFKTEAGAQAFRAASQGEEAPKDTPVGAATAAEPKTPAKPHERLLEMADRMHAKAQETLSVDRQTNTMRRASMAANIESRARREIQLSETMRSIAGAIEAGKAQHLSGVKSKIHLEELEDSLRRAKWNANKELRDSGELSYNQKQELDHRPPTRDDIHHAEYPYPRVHTEHIRSALNMIQEMHGAKKLTAQVRSAVNIPGAHDHGSVARLKTQSQRDAMKKLGEMSDRAVEQGKARFSAFNSNLEDSFDAYDRMQRMGIHTPEEHRTALREYFDLRGKKLKEDKVVKMQRALVGRKFPGYFPTPPDAQNRVVELAGISEGMNVLEPSAGQGHLADAARTAGGNVTTLEFQSELRDVLKEKGHHVAGNDALAHVEEYDRVVMNPPFEKGADMDHVRHAFENNTAPGGRVVAIMSEGAFFRQDKKAKAFREWLAKHGGTSEKLPEGAFKSSDRPTGVNTRIVVIDKNMSKSLQRSLERLETPGEDDEWRKSFTITHGDDVGNFRIASTEGDDIVIEHDESGQTVTMKKSELLDLLQFERLQIMRKRRDLLRGDIAST